jgi:hypothetical protein
MTQPTKPAAGRGSIFLRKTGPLPNWVWMALLLLAALVYSMWQRNRQTTAAEDDPDAVTEPLPGDQTPPPVFIIPQAPQPAVNVPVEVDVHVPKPGHTKPSQPPAGGRPPDQPSKPTKPPVPAPPPKPPAVKYHTVKVAKYTSKNPPWNSTLWGIAKHFGDGSAGGNWHTIWNDPKNAALKKKRGKPERIQPGDTIYVRDR